MIKTQKKTKSGRTINVLIPENADDVKELQKLYDAGKLQAGDHVKGKGEEDAVLS